MKISIAMATYNGARYLQEQLDSFVTQTRMPDELIVCDDGSSDETVEILERFANTAPFKVVIVCNDKNLGYTRNFEKALSLSTGDYIFLSDQDDVWFDNKLEVVAGIFSKSPFTQILVNDQEITDGSLMPSGRTIFMNNRALAYGEEWITAGCCTAITQQFRDLLLPFPVDLIAHDGWLHRVGISLGVRQVLHEVLQYYRRHDQNTSSPIVLRTHAPNRWKHILSYGLMDVSDGWKKELALSKFISQRFSENMTLLHEMHVEAIANDMAIYEIRRAEALDMRIKIVHSNVARRAWDIVAFFHAGNYRYFSGWKSALKDLIR